MRRLHRFTAAILILAASSAMASGKKDRRTVAEALMASARFSRFVAALKEAGLLETLKGPGPYTVFAPMDEAFVAIPRANWEALKANKEDFRRLLAFHIVSGQRTTASLTHSPGGRVRTLQGDDVAIKADGKHVMLWDGMNTANVLMPDIKTTNGIIQGIDTVILPPAPKM